VQRQGPSGVEETMAELHGIPEHLRFAATRKDSRERTAHMHGAQSVFLLNPSWTLHPIFHTVGTDSDLYEDVDPAEYAGKDDLYQPRPGFTRRRWTWRTACGRPHTVYEWDEGPSTKPRWEQRSTPLHTLTSSTMLRLDQALSFAVPCKRCFPAA